jgi:hypothetical protein
VIARPYRCATKRCHGVIFISPAGPPGTMTRRGFGARVRAGRRATPGTALLAPTGAAQQVLVLLNVMLTRIRALEPCLSVTVYLPAGIGTDAALCPGKSPTNAQMKRPLPLASA